MTHQNGTAAPKLRDSKPVDILVRGWDNIPLTYKCLNSIVQNTPAELYRLTYVDNGSNLTAFEHLVNSFPQAQFVRLPFNHGSVRAINAGLALAMFSDSEYILLLDNDTEIPAGDREWLTRFMSYFEDEKVGAAGAVSNYVSFYQHVDAVPDTYNREFTDEASGRIGLKEQPPMPVLVSFAMMVRKAAFLECGFFDELYEPGMGEDYDYTIRVRRAGYKCIVANSVWIHHRGSQTFRKIGFNELLNESMSKFVGKWGKETLAEMGLEMEAV